ncbi:hypothetical protein FDT66_03375 [Polaribacter aestuariivivens]|uniref:Carboxypeptidase-like regulatory domain-containing protein n=1 Tax=Polaribacter aestuariivivens TaxID=2304626 RepID=A0A5S3N6S3_9FLAO|nr:carboxypeptidase-like regulatory domain-containing protein [Polaribacter aestuariivivens]TMM31021.1 hypothetical protein FDT66_03375 [Polaribacter aestuariivivens]
MKKTLLLFLFLNSIFCFSQKKQTFFYGKIIDSTAVVADAHVINLNSKKGTFSNNDGFFKLTATENDSLQISSIGYKTTFIVVKSFNFREKVNFITLVKETYSLNEFTLKRHDLTGVLSLDIKKLPVNRKEKIVKGLVAEIREMGFDKISKMPIGNDEIHLAKPNVVRLPNTFQGFGFSFSLGLGNSTVKEQRLAEKLEESEKTTKEIILLLGDNFFSKELKIPKEHQYRFLNYCAFKGTEELYKNNKILKMISIFRKESISFLKTIKND